MKLYSNNIVVGYLMEYERVHTVCKDSVNRAEKLVKAWNTPGKPVCKLFKVMALVTSIAFECFRISSSTLL